MALDADRAWAAASAADAAVARGEVAGPLHGLPMTVKDVWETEGLLTTAGADGLRDYVPAADALAVGRLKAASGWSTVWGLFCCAGCPSMTGSARTRPPLSTGE